MFDISNNVAYSNLMVQAKPASAQAPVLGPSRWIDVCGNSDSDKWSEAEGQAALTLLKELRAKGQPADFYIVTPFVIVQNNLRRILLDSGILPGWVDMPENWVNERVGTVHTVQGREAAIVLFVLGAASSAQRGARNWAGEYSQCRGHAGETGALCDRQPAALVRGGGFPRTAPSSALRRATFGSDRPWLPAPSALMRAPVLCREDRESGQRLGQQSAHFCAAAFTSQGTLIVSKARETRSFSIDYS